MKIVDLPESIYQEITDRRKFLERCFEQEHAYLKDNVQLPKIVGFSKVMGPRFSIAGWGSVDLEGLTHDSPTGRMLYFVCEPIAEQSVDDIVTVPGEPARIFCLGAIQGEKVETEPKDTPVRTVIVDSSVLQQLHDFKGLGKYVIIM